MGQEIHDRQLLAERITKSASKQTYYTIRVLADRDLVSDAYRAYGYFRWVDDVLDEDDESGLVLSQSEKNAFVKRQKSLLEACYRGQIPPDLCVKESMLVDLVQNDTGKNAGLRSYLFNMMAVMEFDATRRGEVISETELSEYTRLLATSVADAIHYFIGHDDPTPSRETRYLAVKAAHITHMLRDTYEDVEAGYFNIPEEYLRKHDITPYDVDSRVYQQWVCSRIQLARQYFKAGRNSISQVKSLRCQLAGYAYTARFEWVLRVIERDNFFLRSEYRQRKGFQAALWMVWNTVVSIFALPRTNVSSSQIQRISE